MLDPLDEELKPKKKRDPLAERFTPPAPDAQQVAPPAQAKTPVAPAATNVGTAAPVRQQPTGFTNFSRVQAANRDVSNREAAGYAQRAQQNAEMAAQRRADLAERFGGQVAAGTVGGVTADGDVGNADKTYSGPGGLGDLEGIEGVYDSTLGAQQNLDALGSDAGTSALLQQRNQFNGSGNNALSGALIGSAGRKDFDALRARFHPDADMVSAEKNAAELAAKAKTDSEANAKAWGSEKERRDAEKAKAEQVTTDANAERDAKVKKINDEAAFEAKWAAAQGSNTEDEVNRAFGSFNSIMSPITQVAENTGNRDPIADWGRKTLNPLLNKGQAGVNSGSTTGQKIWWQPQHKEVYRQMDAGQWAELNSLPPQAQQGWLEQRRQEIAAGTPHQRYDATRNFSTDPHRYL